MHLFSKIFPYSFFNKKNRLYYLNQLKKITEKIKCVITCASNGSNSYTCQNEIRLDTSCCLSSIMAFV